MEVVTQFPLSIISHVSCFCQHFIFSSVLWSCDPHVTLIRWMMALLLLLCFCGSIAAVPPVGTQPEQVHISYPGESSVFMIDSCLSESDHSKIIFHSLSVCTRVTLMMRLSSGVSTSMVVTWTTVNKTESVVEYGLWGGKLFSHTAKGNSSVFINDGPELRAVYIHRVTLSQLTPAASYGNLHTCSWTPSVFYMPQIPKIWSSISCEDPYKFAKYWVIIINILHFSTHYSTVLFIFIFF